MPRLSTSKPQHSTSHSLLLKARSQSTTLRHYGNDVFTVAKQCFRFSYGLTTHLAALSVIPWLPIAHTTHVHPHLCTQLTQWLARSFWNATANFHPPSTTCYIILNIYTHKHHILKFPIGFCPWGCHCSTRNGQSGTLGFGGYRWRSFWYKSWYISSYVVSKE